MEQLADTINKEIKDSFIYKRYLYLKKEIDENKELKSLKDELEKLKNVICKSKDKELVDLYYEKEKSYKKHPLVEEYLCVKEEVNDLLKDIVDILSLN